MAEVLSVSEAGRELHVSAETIRQMADDGRLPVMRTSGGMRIFRSEDVARAISDRTAAMKQRSAAR